MTDIRRLLQSQPKRPKIESDRFSHSSALDNPSTAAAATGAYVEQHAAPVAQLQSPATIEDDVPEYILDIESADEVEVS